jgi:hypothetical protein
LPSGLPFRRGALQRCEFESTELAASVNFGTCDYKIHINGEVELGPAGCGNVRITSLGCTVTIPGGQTFGAGTLEYKNVATTGKPMEITIHADAAGVHGSTSADVLAGRRTS